MVSFPHCVPVFPSNSGPPVRPLPTITYFTNIKYKKSQRNQHDCQLCWNEQTPFCIPSYTASFPSPTGMSLPKLSLAGNNLFIPDQEDGKIYNLFLQCMFWDCICYSDHCITVDCIFLVGGGSVLYGLIHDNAMVNEKLSLFLLCQQKSSHIFHSTS